jgi:hypothetical protein
MFITTKNKSKFKKPLEKEVLKTSRRNKKTVRGSYTQVSIPTKKAYFGIF